MAEQAPAEPVARADQAPAEAGGEAEPEPVGSRVAGKARQLLKRSQAAVKNLPRPEQLAERSPEARHELLEGLRIELYAMSSIFAERAVARAHASRHEHPPYGLVRSGHTDFRMVLATPNTVEEGELDNFYTFGKAFVDTVVFRLDQLFNELKASPKEAWMVARLEALLALFRVGAGPQTKARMRDGLSFIYGGLHFGTGVTVQLVELMLRLLADYSDLTPDDRAEVIARSSRPALRMAALNLDHIIVAYHEFLAPPERPGGPQWFDPAHFAVQERKPGQPHAIDFLPDRLVAGKPYVPRLDSVRPSYATHGCPARISPAGVSPPIARLWIWGVQLALDAGLLGS